MSSRPAADGAADLLDCLALPDFAAFTPEAIRATLDRAVAARLDVVDRIVAERPDSFEAAWLPFERVNISIETFWSMVWHLHAVVDTPEIREVYGEGERMLTEDWARTSQNRELYDVFLNLSRSPDFAALPDADRTAVERMLRDFRLSGVALDGEDRERFRQIKVELATLQTEFGSAVLDATNAWSTLVTDEAELMGVSDADKAMLRAAAAAAGQDGWRVTLHEPSFLAIMNHAQDRSLRERVYRAYGTRASDQGPDAGKFDNSDRIARILALRQEGARLLGFNDHPAWSLATKMADTAPDILDFLRDLASRAKPAAEREVRALRDFAAERLGIDDMQPWDTAFVSERLRVEAYAVDEQAIKVYFPISSVMKGWQALLDRLFGLRLAPCQDVPLWHPDAQFFDVIDERDGSIIAGIYLDLHARPGKRGGAWMSNALPRVRDGEREGRPVAFVVCNFAPTGSRSEPQLSHADVRTLLHETGHCLHHILTTVDRPSIGGINGFEWDAVELPSQLMEDFAWDRAVLTSMSGREEDGAPLPRELYDAMLAARHFNSGMAVMRQIEFALFDILLHLGTMGTDPVEVLEAVRDDVAVIRPPQWHRFSHGFTHLFASGYASGYYSYLWAEVLAADGFQRFAEAGLVDRATGDLFRREVLSRGSVRPAAESFRAFRGRDADPRALLVRRGLA